MQEKLLNVVGSLGSPKVLVVGDFMLDVYVYGDALRISPEAPVPVLRVKRTESCCGGAGSVAANLAALGAHPACIGIVGDDPDGHILIEKLRGLRAQTLGLIRASDRPTTKKERLVGLAQHRHRQQLIRVDLESTEPLSQPQQEAVLKAFAAALDDADVVCVQDYGKGVVSQPLCIEFVRMAAEAGRKVLVDPAPITDYAKYRGATLITPNRREASLAVGFDIEDTETAGRAASLLMDSLGLEAVVITLDRQGAYLKCAQFDGLVETRSRSVYDVTGAGDVVLATLAVTVAAGCDYETAVRLTNVAGGLEVERFGAVPITREELIHEVAGTKVVSVEMLQQILGQHRLDGRKIVFTNGCFDVLHRGHIEYLAFCKQQGDIVVVGLNSDSSVRRIKGPERPINNEHDRAAVLAALESVDYITVFEDPTPIKLIERVRPDVLVKGEDWKDKGVVGREFVESYGGQVKLAKLVTGRSSTATIEKMKALEARRS